MCGESFGLWLGSLWSGRISTLLVEGQTWSVHHFLGIEKAV